MVVLPVLGQLSQGYVGHLGSVAGRAGKTLVELLVSKNFFLAFGNVPGDVALPLVEVSVLALAVDADVVVAGPFLVRVPPAQRRAADGDAALGRRRRRLERERAVAVRAADAGRCLAQPAGDGLDRLSW